MRYKYSQNLTEASEMTFAENEYQGIEQNGTMKRIPTTKVKQAIDDAIEPINTELSGRLDTLEGTGEGSVAKAIGDLAGAGRTTETVKANADDIISIKGTGYTEGSLKTHEDRLDTLEGTGAGSVAKAIDDAVTPIDTRVTYLESVRGHLYGVRMEKSSGICTPTYDAIGLQFRPQVDTIGTPSDFSSVYPLS